MFNRRSELNQLIIFIFSILFLSSCATTNVSKDFKLEQGSNKGLVVGSITYQGSYSGYSVLYRQIPSGTSGRFQSGQSNVIIPYFPAGEFESLGIKGNLIAAELPEGDYEINSWSVGSGPASVKPTIPFSIKFHISAGKAVYLGNFHFTQLASMGLTITGAKVDFREERKRDIRALSKNYVSLTDVPIESAIDIGEEINELGGKYHTTIILTAPTIVY